MHEHGLAKEIWPQIQQIADDNGFSKVTRVDLTVGSLHGVAAEMMAHSLEDHAFCGTIFDGAHVNVTTVDPTATLELPKQEPTVATGWELMITGMEGDR